MQWVVEKTYVLTFIISLIVLILLNISMQMALVFAFAGAAIIASLLTETKALRSGDGRQHDPEVQLPLDSTATD